jgi:hypothetical protein
MLLGSRPIELILGVDLAARTQSYHLLVYGPDGTYVGFQELLNATAFAGQFDANRRPYMRLRRRLGQSYAHAYFRNVAKGPDPANRMSYRVKFYETPPGSIAKAAVSSLTALLLIYIVAVIMSQSSTAPSSDFPALALAFPALVAAWIGFDGTSQRLFGGTLTSKVSSVFTVICSLGASALFMAQTSTLLQLKLSSFSILGVDQLYWLLILAIATTNAVWSTYAWLGFTTHYYLLARRDIGGPDSYGDVMPEATPA